MATLTLDRIETLSAKERHGVVTELVRNARIKGLDSVDVEVIFDALDTVNLTPGQFLTTDDGTEHINLVLTERNPKVIDKTTVDVELIYEHFVNDGQDLENPPHGVVYAHAQTSISQITVNKYPDDYGGPNATAAEIALRGKLIEVKHTFPDGTTAYLQQDGATALPADPDWPGREFVQTGTIQVTDIQKTRVLDGIVETDDPEALENKCINHVNETTFMSKPAREWLCTDFNREDFDAESVPAKIKVQIEFQHKPGGWDQTAVFTDERTGKPPAGLIEDVGYKTIAYHLETDFNDLFDIIT